MAKKNAHGEGTIPTIKQEKYKFWLGKKSKTIVINKTIYENSSALPLKTVLISLKLFLK